MRNKVDIEWEAKFNHFCKAAHFFKTLEWICNQGLDCPDDFLDQGRMRLALSRRVKPDKFCRVRIPSGYEKYMTILAIAIALLKDNHEGDYEQYGGRMYSSSLQAHMGYPELSLYCSGEETSFDHSTLRQFRKICREANRIIGLRSQQNRHIL
jgi:hypothetical protein